MAITLTVNYAERSIS